MYLQLISLLAILMPEPKNDMPDQVDILPKPINETAQNCIDARLRIGKCMTLAQCPAIVEEYYNEARRNSYGIDFQTFISSSICGFDGNNFLICCRKTTINTATLHATTDKPVAQLYQSTPFIFASLGGYMQHTPTIASNQYTTTMAPGIYPTFTFCNNSPDSSVQPPSPAVVTQMVETIPTTTTTTTITATTTATTTATATQGSLVIQTAQQPINQPNCGVNRGTVNRVVGGFEAKRGNYPWMAALGYRDEYSPSLLKFLCAGSLIAPKYVITSAHCINNLLMLVRLGAHDLTNTAEPEARNYRIKRSIIHDKFDLKTITNDLALIELSETVRMTKFINTICLPEGSNFDAQEFIGMHPFVAGWGANRHQGPTSNVLKDVQLPIINRQECEKSYQNAFKFVKFSEMLICAGNSAADACQGDSGGPLMLPQQSGSIFQYHLLGVVSFGYECARSGFPGVYTKISAYLPWIKNNMI